jgi:hypothetical protein
LITERSSSRTKTLLTTVAVFVTCVTLLVTILAVWAARTVLNTERFTATIESGLQEVSVSEALAGRMAQEIDTLLQELDLAGRFLPEELQPVAPMLRRALLGAVESRAADFLQSERGQELLLGAVEAAHRAVMRVLEGDLPDTDAVVVEDGTVSLNLIPAIGALISRLQEAGVVPDIDPPDLPGDFSPAEQTEAIEDRLGIELPENFGQITVYERDADSGTSAIGIAQRSLELFRRAVLVLIVLTLVLIAVTIFTAQDKRRAALYLGIGAAITGLIAHLMVQRVVEAVPDLLSDPEARAAAADVARSVVSGLDRTVLLLSLAAAVVALAIGGSMLAEGSRIRTALSTVSPTVLRVAGAGLAVLLLLWAGISFASVVAAIAIVVAGVSFASYGADTPAAEPAV